MSCTLLLSIICCCWLATTLVENASANNTPPHHSYVCDDGLVRGFGHRLDQLTTMLEVIRSKTDLQQLRLEQQGVAQELRFDTTIQELVSGIQVLSSKVQNLTATQLQKWLEHQNQTANKDGTPVHVLVVESKLKDDWRKLAAETQKMTTAVQAQLSQLQSAQNESRATVAVMRRTVDKIRALAAGVRELLEPQQASPGLTYSSAPAEMPSSCAEAVAASGRAGNQQLQPDRKQPAFFAPCLADKAGGAAWTLVQRRQNGSIDFSRNWNEYQRGFGNLAGEFFIGLDRLHALTHSKLHELCIQLEDFEGAKRHACYDAFAIGDASRNYTLELLGNFSGDVGDSLRYHQGMKFSTKDKDTSGKCATKYGAWWHKWCHHSNLNGLYLKGKYGKDKDGSGVVWGSWHGDLYSLKYVHMAIRPVT